MIKQVTILCVLLLISVGVMAADETTTDLKLLEQAKAFSHGDILGQATKNELFTAYKRLCLNWNKIDPAALGEMLKAATPAGKLYASALISETNCYRGQPANMKDGFGKLRTDKTKVMYRSGCLVSEHTVDEIAQAFLDKGQFQDFGLSKWCEKPVSTVQVSADSRPAAIVLLSKADRFYGPTPGESGQSSAQKAYVEATGKVSSFETADLNWLLKNGTPAGRIYGAVLLWQSGRIGPNLSFGLLVNDSATIEYQDGCKVMESKVNEIAKSLMESGKFMNFQLGSMFCKMKAPTKD